jgi:hypothetical protein
MTEAVASSIALAGTQGGAVANAAPAATAVVSTSPASSTPTAQLFAAVTHGDLETVRFRQKGIDLEQHWRIINCMLVARSHRKWWCRGHSAGHRSALDVTVESLRARQKLSDIHGCYCSSVDERMYGPLHVS